MYFETRELGAGITIRRYPPPLQQVYTATQAAKLDVSMGERVLLYPSSAF